MYRRPAGLCLALRTALALGPEMLVSARGLHPSAPPTNPKRPSAVHKSSPRPVLPGPRVGRGMGPFGYRLPRRRVLHRFSPSERVRIPLIDRTPCLPLSFFFGGRRSSCAPVVSASLGSQGCNPRHLELGKALAQEESGVLRGVVEASLDALKRYQVVSVVS